MALSKLNRLFSIPNSVLRSISSAAYKLEPIESRNCRYTAMLCREDLDGWELRQIMNDLVGFDAVPDVKIINAVLEACRRLNDYAISVRFLEACHDKCGSKVDEIWPYIKQETSETVRKLGANYPEDLCYDRPELALKSIFDM